MNYINETLKERKDLLNEFPFLKPYKNNPEYLNPESETWLTGMPKGWYNLLLDMFREIKNVLIENDFLNDYEILQLKEKFGVITLYDNTPLTNDIISKYEKLSTNTCAFCGKPATKCTKDWIIYLCDDCYDKVNRS